MNNREKISEVMRDTGKMPQEYLAVHKGTHACAVLSNYLFDLFLKIKETATPEQKDKFFNLQNAYVDIVNDLSHVNRLEYLVERYQMKYEIIKRENDVLKKENEKLLKSLEFQNINPLSDTPK